MNEGTVPDQSPLDQIQTTPQAPVADIAGSVSDADILDASKRVLHGIHPSVHDAIKQLGVDTNAMSPREARKFKKNRVVQKALGSSLVRLGIEQEKARTDTLTHIPNRLGFEEELEKRIAMGKEHPFGVLYLDLDDFKLINDVYGHPEGDAFLKSSARFIKDHVRRDDYVARTGGDEFAFIVDLMGHEPLDGEHDPELELEPEDRLDRFAERLETMFREQVETTKFKRHEGVGVSVGAAVFVPGMTGSEIKTIADTNMIARKREHHAIHGAHRPVIG